MTGRIHVVGAGLAGLACATRLAQRGHRVALYEATDHAGGRCRSWHDSALDRIIDNGNHLILGANAACFAYLDRVGGRDGLVAIDPVQLPFLNLTDGQLWSLRPGSGPLPLWLADPDRRVPGSRLRDYLTMLKLALAGPNAIVTDHLPTGHPLTRLLWQPLAVSILNTPYDQGSARLLWQVFRRTLLRGARACRPHIAGPGGLSAALVDPALAYLRARNVEMKFGWRLRALERAADGGATALVFGHGRLRLSDGDKIILALPAETLPDLLPDVVVPDRFHAILNAHFRLDAPARLPGGLPLLALIGGTAEWLFMRGDVLSVTVSAADTLMDLPATTLVDRLWQDVCRALRMPEGPPPPHRIIKERRATFAATPAMAARRPGPRLAPNLFLAGDWTDTGLPATIEGAIQSGHRAADLIKPPGR